MNRHLWLLATATLLLHACAEDAGPALSVTDLRVLAPLTGSQNGVAYMSFRNRGDRDIVIGGAKSAQFERVELHKTSINNGVSRMQSIDALTVPAGGEVKLAEGATHFMLINARDSAVPGTPVILEIAHSEGLLILDAELQSRFSPVE